MKSEKVVCEVYKNRGLECYCGNLRMAARMSTQLYDEVLKPSGLRATQLSLLWAVYSLQPATVTEIAGTIVADGSTVTRNLAILKRKRLVASRTGHDARERLVRVTASGEAALAKAMPLWEEAQKRFEQQLGAMLARSLNRSTLKIAGHPTR